MRAMIRRAAAALLVAFACVTGQPAFAEPPARGFIPQADLVGAEGDADAAMDAARTIARRQRRDETARQCGTTRTLER